MTMKLAELGNSSLLATKLKNHVSETTCRKGNQERQRQMPTLPKAKQQGRGKTDPTEELVDETRWERRRRCHQAPAPSHIWAYLSDR